MFKTAPILGAAFRANGQAVTYRRGAQTISVVALVGYNPQEVIENGEVRIAEDLRDFYLRVTDLVIASVAITPAAGDVITQTINARGYDYEVLPIGNNREAVPEDLGGFFVKVHAKLNKINV